MARSRRRPRRTEAHADASFDAFLSGWKRTEVRGRSEWTVQPISSARAQKVYTCPGCPRDIAVGEAHVVVWRNDGVLGDAADLAARRHWHTACWRIG